MSEKAYKYVACNACFVEERLETDFHARRRPVGWVEVTGDGVVIWDLCPACHKEVIAMLFAKERIDRIVERPRIDVDKIVGPCVTVRAGGEGEK